MILQQRFIWLFLVFISLCLYYPSLFAGANSVDDVKMITNLLNLEHFSLKSLFLPGGGYYYRPLLYLTFIVDKYAWGLQESFMHLENMLLHTLNVILVYGIAIRIRSFYPTSSSLFPFVAAILFAVHPIATESVNWISGRTDVLAGTFILSALLFLLFGLEKKSNVVVALGAICYFLSCLSKESAVSALPAIILIIYATEHTASSDKLLTRIRRRILSYLLFTATAAGYFVFRHYALGSGDSGIKTASTAITTSDYDVFNKIRICLKLFGFYAKKLFVPWPLNFAIVQVSDLYVLVGLLVILVCLWLVYRRDVMAALFLMSACFVVPALLVPLGQMAWTPIAERYLYMSSAPFCIAACLAVHQNWPKVCRSRALIWGVSGIIAASACTTAKRNIVWQNNLTLFQDTVEKSPDFAPVKNELALALEKSGRRDEANRIYLSNVLPTEEKYSIITDLNRARALAAKGDNAGARRLLIDKQYERGKPLYADYLELLVTIDERLLQSCDNTQRGELQQEIGDLLKKMAEFTGDPFYYYRTGQKLMAMKKPKEAEQCFLLAYEKSPEGAFYKLPAKILAQKMAGSSGITRQ